jgi:glycerophosphoryl diester phosphodiesterase
MSARRIMTVLVAAAVTTVGAVAGLSGVAEATESHHPTVATGTRAPLDMTAAGQVLVIAHRGASARAPENTLPAMRAAAAAGADLVEFDVQRTADGHLIIVHDTTFARTTNVAEVFPGRQNDPVGSFTLSEVRQLDAGSWKGPQYAGTHVPTLRSLLTTMRPTRTGLLLELKNPMLYAGYESQVAHLLTTTGFVAAGRVWVHSFDADSLERLHDLAPSVPVGLITENGAAPGADTSWLTTVNTTTGTLSDAMVDSAGNEGLGVVAWPALTGQDTRAQMERLVGDGVTAIVTAHPAIARSVAAQARA